MIKLFLLIDSLNMGGAEKLLVNFANITKNDDSIIMKVGVLNPYRNDSIYKQLVELDIEVVMFESEKSRELLDLKRFRKIFEYVKKEKFDLIHTHLLYSHLIGGLISILTRIPFVATIHSELFVFSATKKFLRTFILMFAKRIHVVTNRVIEDSPRCISKKMVYMPNAIPTFPSLIKRNYHERQKDLELVFVGRLAKVKRVDTIVKAFSLLLLEDKNFKLNIIGDGKEKQKLIDLSRSLSIPEDKIIFHGLQENVTKFLLESDVFVLSSQNEGLPLALLEAMAAGLPVIATPVGEIPQIINSNSGIIFPVGDIKKLNDAILYLKNNPAICEKMSIKNQEIIHEHFSIQSWWKKVHEEYTNIIERKK